MHPLDQQKQATKFFSIHGLPIVLVSSNTGWELQTTQKTWTHLQNAKISQHRTIDFLFRKYVNTFKALKDSPTLSALIEESEVLELLKEQ